MMASSLRLLIVEDVEDHALLLVRQLRGAFDVAFERAETPRELEAALDAHPWDAVIADFNLPGFNGLDALRMMQARGLDLPFLLVSGVIGEEMAVEAMKAGAHDFILKGSYSRLVPALERELREATVRRERRQAEAELASYREHLEELVRERTAELEQARDAAEAANRAKSEFLTNMSHEMRTPLTGVMGILDFLLMDYPQGEQRSYLEMAYNSAESLKRLIDDILDFSMLAAGKMSFRLKPFDLRDCIRSAAEVLTLEAGRKELRFDLEIDEELPERVVSDEGRLRQVLINLIGNAVKFTEQGEIHVACRRAPDPDGPGQDLLMCSVRDTGVGIPADYQEKIFEKFTQVNTPARRNFGGCGLGLAISRQIVETLGGNIWVESRNGEGSVFTFTILLDEAIQESCQGGKKITAGSRSHRTLDSKGRPTAQELFASMLSAVARRGETEPLGRFDQKRLAGEAGEGQPPPVH
jgi:signal transduction histidine kinase